MEPAACLSFPGTSPRSWSVGGKTACPPPRAWYVTRLRRLCNAPGAHYQTNEGHRQSADCRRPGTRGRGNGRPGHTDQRGPPLEMAGRPCSTHWSPNISSQTRSLAHLRGPIQRGSTPSLRWAPTAPPGPADRHGSARRSLRPDAPAAGRVQYRCRARW